MKYKTITTLFILALFLPLDTGFAGKHKRLGDRGAESDNCILGSAEEMEKKSSWSTPKGTRSEADLQREEQSEQRKKAVAQRQEEQRLASDPKYYFEKKIQGKYGLLDGKPVPLELVVGNVLQVINDKTIVISQTHTKYCRSGWNDPVGYQIEVRDPNIVVVLTNTQGIVDGMVFRQKATPTGTHSDETGGTLAKYTTVPDITYDQFLNLRSKRQ